MTREEIIIILKERIIDYNVFNEAELKRLELIDIEDELLDLIYFLYYSKINRELLSHFFEQRTINILKLSSFVISNTYYVRLLRELLKDMKVINNNGTCSPTYLLNCAVSGCIPMLEESKENIENKNIK